VGWGKLAQNLGMLLLAWVGTWKPESAPRTAAASEQAAEPSLSR
jgi:hypothetical protein